MEISIPSFPKRPAYLRLVIGSSCLCSALIHLTLMTLILKKNSHASPPPPFTHAGRVRKRGKANEIVNRGLGVKCDPAGVGKSHSLTSLFLFRRMSGSKGKG